MTLEGAQLISVLAIAAVLTSYARVLFSACKKLARATGMFLSRELPERNQSNVTRVMEWRGPPIKPTRPYKAVGLLVTATAAVVVWIGGSLIFALNTGSPAHVIATGANETTTTQLPDGSVLSLGARSMIKVDVTNPQYVAYLLEGEGTFKVALELPKPFVVETFLAKATAAAGARFRVAIDSSVEFEVYEGVVQVLPRGAKAGAPAITLQKGRSYRVPVSERSAIATSMASRLKLSVATS